MKKIMFMLVAVAAMASSCTQSDVIGLSSDDNVEIRVSAGITSAVSPVYEGGSGWDDQF